MKTTKPTLNQACGSSCDDGGSATVARPAYEVVQRDHGVSLHLAVPGVKKEDLTVSVEQDLLTVVARRTSADPAGARTIRPLPHPDRYQLEVRLHRDLDAGSVQARLADGLLTIDLERHEAAKPRSIAIN